MSKEIDHSYTKEIICPWCGYEISDSWEMSDSDDECECGDCYKIFSYEREFEITYSSSRKQCNSKCKYILSSEEHGCHRENPYIYNNKNWTLWSCKTCHHEIILTGPLSHDKKPYIQFEKD